MRFRQKCNFLFFWKIPLNAFFDLGTWNFFYNPFLISSVKTITDKYRTCNKYWSTESIMSNKTITFSNQPPSTDLMTVPFCNKQWSPGSHPPKNILILLATTCRNLLPYPQNFYPVSSFSFVMLLLLYIILFETLFYIKIVIYWYQKCNQY